MNTRTHNGLATSFRVEEVKAMKQLIDVLLAGGDPKVIVRSINVRKAFAKFQRMYCRGKERGCL
jgi:hypothetical protein